MENYELNADRLIKLRVISDTEGDDLVFHKYNGLIRVSENDNWVAIKVYQDGINISSKHVINRETIVRIEYFYEDTKKENIKK